MPDNFLSVQIHNLEPSPLFFKVTYNFIIELYHIVSISYFANEERFHLFLADVELGDVIGGIPKCLIHQIVGIH